MPNMSTVSSRYTQYIPHITAIQYSPCITPIYPIYALDNTYTKQPLYNPCTPNICPRQHIYKTDPLQPLYTQYMPYITPIQNSPLITPIYPICAQHLPEELQIEISSMLQGHEFRPQEAKHMEFRVYRD